MSIAAPASQAHDSPTSAQASFDTVWDQPTLLAQRSALVLARQQRVREFMRRADLPVLLLLDPNHIFYACGARNMQLFTLRTPARYLLLFESGPALLYEYAGSEHLATHLPTLSAVRPSISLSHVSSGGRLREASERFASEIAAQVRSVDPAIDLIGIERFPVYATDALRQQGFTLRDADDAMTPARAVRLPIELPYMREAMRRVEQATRSLEQGIAPGRTESEIWSGFWFDFMATDGQQVSTRLFQSGPRTFPYFQECGSRVVQAGDLLCLDTDAQGFEGYAVDFSRTFLCGDLPATAGQRQLYRLAQEQLAHNAGNLQAGMSYEEFARRAWPVPDQYRPTRYGNIGHGLGMAGEFPNIAHFDPAAPYPIAGQVEPGMVICLESYIGSAAAGQGVKLEQQYLIHADHVECLSNYPFDARLGGG